MKNQAAFPSPGVVIPSGPGSATTPYQQGAYEGMTLRDYFAAKAMQAMVNSGTYETGGWDQRDIAIQSYQMADAMLAERENP